MHWQPFSDVARGTCWLLLLLMAASVSAADLPSSSSHSDDNLNRLMVLFQNSGGVRAEYEEKRHVSILSDPIETEGLLFFSPPDRLARYTTHPGHASLIVNGNRLTIQDEMGQRSMNLESSELASGLVDSFAVLLRGDLKALQSGYEASLSATQSSSDPDSLEGANWILDLEPRSSTIRGLIERIRIQGKGGRLVRMETLETNGDRSVMLFSGVQTGLQFEPEEIERFFSVPSSKRSP